MSRSTIKAVVAVDRDRHESFCSTDVSAGRNLADADLLQCDWTAPVSRSLNSIRSLELQVFVRDNNIDQALRMLKRKLQREGLFREMKRRRFYEKPSEKSTREKSEAVRRRRKLLRKKAIFEGLIAAPKKLEQRGRYPHASPATRPRVGRS
jgi:small subunit ribosomal protein S21